MRQLARFLAWLRSHGRSQAMRIRALAALTRSLGAKLGANDHRRRATAGHIQPLSLQPNGTSGHIQHHPGTLRKCLLSSRSRVRVAVGAQLMQVSPRIRNYCHSNDLLHADNHSHLVWLCGTRRRNAVTRQNEVGWPAPRWWSITASQTGSQTVEVQPGGVSAGQRTDPDLSQALKAVQASMGSGPETGLGQGPGAALGADSGSPGRSASPRGLRDEGRPTDSRPTAGRRTMT